MEYKKGRCIIGNPPFGKGNYTSVNFYQKSIQICDYISFIQPISQLNNQMYMYQFDLVHSEDLGKHTYTDRKIHCCLNIYKRPKQGYNVRPTYDLTDVTLRGVARGKSRNDKIPDNYSFSISGFGNIGTICDYEYQYCQQIYFVIHNKKLENQIKEIIKTADWKSMYGMTSVPKLKHWMIYKFLKEKIPEIK